MACQADSSGNPTSTTCKKCSDGFHLEAGVCQDCSVTSNNCKSCSSVKCVECFSGYVADSINNICKRCDTKIPYCTDCSSLDTCNSCDNSIANIDKNGKCTNCKTENGWTFD